MKRLAGSVFLVGVGLAVGFLWGLDAALQRIRFAAHRDGWA